MKLSLPSYKFQIKSENDKKYIYDEIRLKHVLLTPEEWVRQHLIKHLISKGFPAGLISIERTLPKGNKRYDAVVYNREMNPFILVECKSPNVTITQKTIEQVTSYLLQLDCPYVLVSNGINSYWIERRNGKVSLSKEIPDFSTISG